ncbi:MAG: hypothetical protein A2W26_04920 [Acidobacteria bacterium RBG_16_64_8]|nr:MAG: hypothetical protein A2W26_04920 [Acidobacteria bacterium RBG_16_64_8]
MITQPRASGLTFAEYPVMFPSEGQALFGILTQPEGRHSRGVGVVLLSGGSFTPAQNRNRVSVRLARLLAGDGFSVLRFDYHGVGESEGTIAGYALDRPFVSDLEAALRWWQTAGMRRFVLVGSCFGARTIAATVDRISGVDGLVLISTPMMDFEMGDAQPTHYVRKLSTWQLIRRAARPRTILNLIVPRARENRRSGRRIAARTVALKVKALTERALGNRKQSWMSEPLIRQLSVITQRRIPMLLMYGEEEIFYRDFSEARSGPLQPILARGNGTIEVQTVPGVLHGFTSLAVQDETVERTMRWIRTHLTER